MLWAVAVTDQSLVLLQMILNGLFLTVWELIVADSEYNVLSRCL